MDKDHDGAIGCEEIEAALRMATNKLGVPGSPWKMYVDPAQSVMCYHNVQTDEKVRWCFNGGALCIQRQFFSRLAQLAHQI